MKKSLEELINVAINLQLFFGVSHFDLYVYDSGSHVDFHLTRITKLPDVLDLASGLEMKFWAEENEMIVRLLEREDESECFIQ